MKLEDLPLESLDLDDRTFDLGFARRHDALRQAVAAVGVLQPLIVRPGANRARGRIVCGFGRAQAARELNLARIPARVLPAATSDADCLRLAMFDNLPHRRFNPLERAIILSKLGRHFDRDRLLADYLPLLGLQPSASLLERTIRLLQLIEPLQWALAEGQLEEKVGVALAALPPIDQEAFAGLLARCRPSVSVAREWTEALLDIVRRDNRSLGEILAAPELAALLESPEKTDAERAAAVRRHLHQRRYPALSAREAQFAAARTALHLPPSMRLEAAASFESDELRLEVRFRGDADLREALALLQSRLDDPTLIRNLWGTTPGAPL